MNRYWRLPTLILGFIFLYAPLVILVIFSFNRSQLVNVWGGWSLHWYYVLMHDHILLQSALLSLKIGLLAPTFGIIIGTLAAFSLVRYRRFRGRSLFYVMNITPIILPDVVTGLALLLLFVSLHRLIGIPSHYGLGTILIAHTTFCSAYATIIIRARLSELDMRLEEAAMDLGASPLTTFISITIPQIRISLLSAWLLAFTLSLDDMVITTFVSGPGASTLPMYIFSTLKTGVTPEINALASILITVVLIGLGVACWATSKQRQKS